MSVSVFDLFKIGIGPSSSHTVGPMKAAAMFAARLAREPNPASISRVEVRLYGSLAHTGRGHGTDKAVLLGLEGCLPDQVDPDQVDEQLDKIRSSGRLQLAGGPEIRFNEKADLVFRKREMLPYHSNGMRFKAFDAHGSEISSRDYYSVGGGFVVNRDQASDDVIVDGQHTSALSIRIRG